MMERDRCTLRSPRLRRLRELEHGAERMLDVAE
jgi:hypothetical protein